MRNLKKVLSLVLCMAMMLSVMVVGAGAAFKDQEKIVNDEAVDMCSALNIINGYTDGSYKPEGTITRAEACKMICIALNGGKEPVLGTNAIATFTDIKGHWAEKYIEYCVSEGIVAGIGGGKFNPNGNVTGSQFAKMLLIALGYNAEHAKFLGNAWEVNVNVKATQKGLYEDLETMDPSVALSRDNAAQMVWNALQAYTVEYDYTLVSDNGSLSSQVVVKDTKTTLLYANYKGIIVDTTLEAIDYNSDKAEWEYTVSTSYPLIEKDQGTDVTKFISDEDYCDLYKQAVKVIFTVKNGAVDTVLGVVSDADIVTEGLIGDIGDVDTTNKEVEIDDVDYKLEGSSVTYAEFKVGVAEDYLDAEKDDAYVFQAIDNNDNGRIDVIVYYPFDVAQIEYLSSTSIKMTGITNTDLDDVNLYTGAEEDDWVVVTAAKNACDETMSVVKADVITGEVSSTKTNGDTVEEILVDGTWYNVSEKCTGDDLVLNTKFDLVVVNGYVFNADETEGNVAADNILYVDDAAALSTGLTNAVEAKVYFADGTSATVKVTELDDNDIVATPKKDKDEITPAKAAEGMENNLYTFTEKNGEYALETVDNNNKGSFDAYNIITSGTVKDGKVGSIRFAENAVIFVEDADGVKVVTGKTIANWGETSITSLQYLANTTNGVLYTEIGAIVMDGVAKTDMGAYGFVTSSITNTKDSDGTAYLNFTMWDGKESVPVKVEAKDLDVTIAKYSFVSFDWAAEGEADADSVIVKTVSGDARPITAFVLGDTITQNGVSKLNTWDFADDYVIIGVDTKNGKGVDSAALKVAKEVPGSNPVELYSNTVIFTVKDGDKDVVEAVFVDINGAMYLDGVAQSIDKIVPEA